MQRQKWIIWLTIILVIGSIIIILNKGIRLGLDLKGGAYLIYEIDTSKLEKSASISDAQERVIEVIRNRIDQLGVAEPQIIKTGEKWITIQLPGMKDPQHAKEIIGKTALLEFRLVEDDEKKIQEALNGNVPVDKEILYDDEKKPYLVEKEPYVTGAFLKTAKMMMGTPDLDNPGPYVTLEFNNEGAKRFAKVTSENVGKRLAIVLDRKVHSAPNIREPITHGKAQITGRFTLQEAKDLALVLRAGALPVPINIISETSVGPTLGKDSIRKGTIAGIIGAFIVILIMAFYYRVSGIIADIGVFANVIILLGCLSLVDATLTLPGIAGIILTVGMSVDANVLIFERIREELRAGKTIRAAIDAGYRHALVAIIDSHVTTLITAAVLFMLGTGPIKGFAVTLTLGVIINLYTSVIITRLIFDWRTSQPTVTELSI
jgi:protein-export membrane protein SecD